MSPPSLLFFRPLLVRRDLFYISLSIAENTGYFFKTVKTVALSARIYPIVERGTNKRRIVFQQLRSNQSGMIRMQSDNYYLFSPAAENSRKFPRSSGRFYCFQTIVISGMLFQLFCAKCVLNSFFLSSKLTIFFFSDYTVISYYRSFVIAIFQLLSHFLLILLCEVNRTKVFFLIF